RDRTVTGVQTCALPISFYQHIGYIEHVSEQSGAWMISIDPIEWFGTPAEAQAAYRHDTPGCAARNSCLPPNGYYIRNREAHVLEIGRASCRERVKGRGG